MRIATWNVNSIRTRLEIVTNWLQQNPVDVLCVQETKAIDSQFPIDAIAACGYHAYISGQKSYNGVAMFSKQPLTNVSYGFGGILDAELVGDLDEQKRVITGNLDGVQIVNLYVPNGNAVDSDKYPYKLRWLELLGLYLKTAIASGQPSICVCGDFNIALEYLDIHTKTVSKDRVMATDAERELLRKSVIDLGFRDSFRKFTSTGGHFSWWDYRQQGFERNRGWRIDHLYLTPDLFDLATNCSIDIEPRKLVQPSDHAPVIVEL
ncbi:exodeoxyribonuclease III [Chamaesiphon sp. VAR_48_metabat_403]|uniref:exodeoxyribonuclease III n=1 Tax=Chamaesiphon sp. VAR_48_metabat_403 TaxID=2964700 RepID=UPI00286E83B9|nr:exodeoxyribonuclease III [Chamaesiphon sp. VAR_48_metabat_403]